MAFALYYSAEPRCQDAMDVDEDGSIQINDAIRIFQYAHSRGPPPAFPFPNKGIDPTVDDLEECREDW